MKHGCMLICSRETIEAGDISAVISTITPMVFSREEHDGGFHESSEWRFFLQKYLRIFRNIHDYLLSAALS